MKKTSIVVMAILLFAINTKTFAQITGTVYRDYNGNGTRETAAPTIEPGIPGVIVTAYNASDAVVNTTTTSSTGAYTLAYSVPVRLEFKIPTGTGCVNTTYDFSSFSGEGNNVRFVTSSPSTQNYAINSPADYVSNTNPYIFASKHVNGNPLGGGNSGTSSWFVAYPYNSSGSGAPPKTLTGTTIGTTWGVAYSKQARKIFTTAFVKRHAGLGTLGTGGIYMLDTTASSFNVTSFFNMDAPASILLGSGRTRADTSTPGTGYGPTKSFTITTNNTITFLGANDPASGLPRGLGVIGSNGDRGLPAARTTPNYDPAAFDQVGKVGLGNIEISTDGKFLFVANLYDRKIYRLELNDAYNPTSVIAVTSYSLPATTVNNGVLRLFATKFFRGKLYVGAVATGENGGVNNVGGSTDLYAFVFELNDAVGTPSFTSTPVTTFPLNYAKGAAMAWTTPDYGLKWYPWTNRTDITVGSSTNRTYPQPILSDIEFDERGDMILSFMDRGGHQWGEDNYRDLSTNTTVMRYALGGDILVAGNNCNNTFSIENNGAYTSANGTSYNSGAANNEGPGNSEFFKGDAYSTFHNETSLGSLAFLKGSQNVYFGTMDPLAINSGGTKRLSMSTGLTVGSSAYQLYGGGISEFGKASALGDIELTGTEPPIEIGNRVWNDANGDGIQGPSEAGINGVILQLYADFNNDGIPDGAALGTATTSGAGLLAGSWYFNTSNVTDGDPNTVGNQAGPQPNKTYIVRLATSGAGNDWDPTANGGLGGARSGGDLAGFNLTKLDIAGNGETNLSDNDAAIVSSIPQLSVTTGAYGQNNHSLDFGFTPPASLGDKVWIDTNANGVEDGSEVGLSGVTVTLIDCSGNPIDGDIITPGVQPITVVTDGSGNYNFIELVPGSYGVSFTLPSGYVFSPKDAGGDDTKDSDADVLTGKTSCVTLAPGDIFTTLDAGVYIPASVGNKVWLDNGAGGGTSNDGLQNGTEPGVAGVTVTLYNSTGVVIGTTVTDAYGNYLFTGLAPGDYSVGFTLPTNYTFTSQTNTADDGNTTGSGATALSINGSDVNPLTGKTYTITLSAGENNLNIDAGLVYQTASPTNSIGDKVWFDTNGDGVQDSGEPGIAGITVVLYAADGTTVVAITTTDANGNYIFNNLPPSTDYIVGFSAPAGTVFTSSTGTTVGNATTNSDPDPITGKTSIVNTGAAGNQITGIDAGIVNDVKGAIGDFVWNDINKNGVQDAGEPGISGVTMQLYSIGANNVIGGGDDVLISTVTTDVNGYYVFPNLDPGKYFVVATPVVGYTVTSKDAGSNDNKDSDFATNGAYPGKVVSPIYQIQNIGGGLTRDMSVDLGMYNSTNNLNSIGDVVWNDVNRNGLQDVGELGVPNVTVRLLDGSGVAVNNPSTGLPYVVATDADGKYLFADLADGNYIIEFANIPSTYSFTSKDASGSGNPGSGTDGNDDSDADPITGRTGIVDLDASSSVSTSVNITNVDAGVKQGAAAGLGSLGDKVWYDLNGDGIQTAGEPGVAGVTVELLDGSGNSIDPDGAGPLTQTTTTTNALGEYLFGGLSAGQYKVEFSNLPVGFVISPKDQGANDLLDSDGDNAGITITGITTSTTGVYSLAIGEDILSVDLGIIPPTATNSLGDFVWLDVNTNGVQNVGEPGIVGVMVTLLNADGSVYDNDVVTVGVQPYVTTTDVNGFYKFVGLPDGEYRVQFSNLPTGLTFTAIDASAENLGTDSDADVLTGVTAVYDLDNAGVSGTSVTETKVDAGLVSTKAVLGDKVWLDSNGDGIQDANESGIAGVTVILYGSDGTTVISSTITDANGNYLFTNLDAGSYVVGFSTLPSNLEFTQQNTPGDNGDNTNSDANPSTGKTGVIVLTAGEVDLTIDAGVRPAQVASVGDFVWNDVNNNGAQGANEPGVPGIIVTLYDASDNVIGAAITNGNGKYLISNIPPGNGYYIIFSNLPPVAAFTIQSANVTPGDATLGSDAHPATGKTPSFNLSGGQYLPTVDAGIIGAQLLPVRIIDFTAAPLSNTSVKTNWFVGEEEGVQSFVVEHSIDGNTFTAIGTLTRNGSNNYSLVDMSPINGVNYYRLKVITINGFIKYSTIRKVIFGRVAAISVYPVPANDFVSVTFTDSYRNKAVVLNVLSLDGKLLSKTQLNSPGQTEHINVSKLPVGQYVLKIVSMDETVVKPILIAR